MATVNPFDLLGDDDNDDPSQLVAAHQLKAAAAKKTAPTLPAAAAKLPSKPLSPSQAVRETRGGSAAARHGAGRGGPGRGRGGRGGGSGANRDFRDGNANGFARGYGGGASGGGEDVDAVKPFEKERNFDRERGAERERGGYGGPRQSYRGGRRGGFVNGEVGGDSERPPRRTYERRSGTGRGYEMKREGAGRGNWGTATDDVIGQEAEENLNSEEKVVPEKQPEQEDGLSSKVNKENKEEAKNEKEEKEEEDKEMTLDEYEKVREEKRKALLSMKSQERKVDFDKEFESMQQLSIKKGNDDIFVKLGADKDLGKRKDGADKEERAKKVVSINEFLKPAGERYYSPGGRGRGRGRGDHGSFRGGFGRGAAGTPAAPSIEDHSQFPTLGGK